MPQIAQQDYLRISIADVTALTAGEKAEIRKHVEQGTIWDALIVNGESTYRVLSVLYGADQIEIMYTGDSLLLEYV